MPFPSRGQAGGYPRRSRPPLLHERVLAFIRRSVGWWLLVVLRRAGRVEEGFAGLAEHLVEAGGGDEDLARLGAVQAADDAAAFHHVDQAGGAGVADLELALDHRGG